MRLVSRPPIRPALAPIVRLLWYCERPGGHGVDRVLPTGAVQLVIDLSGSAGFAALAVGPQDCAVEISAATMRRSVGAVLRVGAGRAIGAPCGEVRGRTVALADLWGDAAEALRTDLAVARDPAGSLHLLESALYRRLVAAAPASPVARSAVCALAAGCSVQQVVDSHGLSRAGLGRLFHREVGLSPKRWAGIARFQNAVRLLAAGAAPLAGVALRCGYADQAHLTRAFGRYGGVTPGDYRPRTAGTPNHLAI